MTTGDAFAQGGTASLSGRVTDPQGEIVVGARVVAFQPASGFTREALTDAAGRFSIPLLPPGVFELRVTLAGFAPWTATNVDAAVGRDVILDVRLAVGQIAETIELDETGSPARTAAVDGVISASRIEQLPLNGRNFLELALLVPGNQLAPTFDPTKTTSVLVSSAGQLGRGGNVTIDGADNNDDVVGGPLVNLPIDAVQEFQMATNRFAADLGRSASSVINVVTRSGTNQTRGSASVFLRDSAWQGLPATFDRSAGTPPFDRQQYAGSGGGALKPDRAFWFGAVEYRNQDGAILVGERDTATRTIRRSFASAPLDDRLWMLRLDAGPGSNRLSVRYAGESSSDTGASTIERAIGTASQRQTSDNRYHDVQAAWTRVLGPTMVNSLNGSVSRFFNETLPVSVGPQLTFPSLQAGTSFRVPQATWQQRLQVSDTLSMVRGRHTIKSGGSVQRIDAKFDLRVFQHGRIELVQDFPFFDHNADGRIDDDDLLFAVTLRSGVPDRPLVIPDADNWHVALFAQDDWQIGDRLQVGLGLRYELDTEVNNQSRVAELNPIVQSFLTETRRRDTNNWAPRLGFVWTPDDARTLVRGGYGIYYDRIVLQILSLERGLDGRALPIEVRAGNALFLDPDSGRVPPFAPSLSNPFTGFILPGAGASGINLIDPHLQNPMVHQLHLGVEREVMGTRVRADVVHDQGTHFLISRNLGTVYNPVVGGEDRVVNLESSARTKYDALLLSASRRLAGGASVRASYTLSKAFNYANDDQIPFSNGPIDATDLRKEYGPTPNDRRHRFVASVDSSLPWGVRAAGIWTISSGVPMDILLPDASSRIPSLQRNAGGRLFHAPDELNAFIASVNAAGGVDGVPLPLVSNQANFGDGFNALDLRISRPFRAGSRTTIEPMLEVFNLFNVTNVLGVTNVNYSGFSNVLVRDSEDPAETGFLQASQFGRAVTTAGGVFGSGGPRAMQIAARVRF